MDAGNGHIDFYSRISILFKSTQIAFPIQKISFPFTVNPLALLINFNPDGIHIWHLGNIVFVIFYRTKRDLMLGSTSSAKEEDIFLFQTKPLLKEQIG